MTLTTTTLYNPITGLGATVELEGSMFSFWQEDSDGRRRLLTDVREYFKEMATKHKSLSGVFLEEACIEEGIFLPSTIGVVEDVWLVEFAEIYDEILKLL